MIKVNHNMNKINDKIPAIPPTKEFRCFLAVAKSGKFNLAAKALNLTESAVSHQITRLENRLGVTLFYRDNKGAKLSRDGANFLSKTEQGYALLYQAVDELKNNDNFKVTITLPRALAVRWFSTIVIEINQLFPSIELQVLATERICDFAKEDIDIGVRYISSHTQLQLIKHYNHAFIAQETLSPICSQQTKEKIVKQGWENSLNELVLIKNKVHQVEWNDWIDKHPMALPSQSIELDDYDLCFQACLSSQGIMMGRTPMPERLNQSQAMPIFPDKSLVGKDLYLIWRADINYTKPIKALITLLTDRLFSLTQ